MIVAAAIRLSDGKVYSVEKPGRHCDVIRKIIAERAYKNVRNETQGFLTDTGIFLDREWAGAHALACGQVKKLGWPSMGLNSEDVW